MNATSNFLGEIIEMIEIGADFIEYFFAQTFAGISQNIR